MKSVINATPAESVCRILLCLIALVFLLGATSRVDSILDIPDGTTIDFEVDTCDFIPGVLFDCFTPFDMVPSEDPYISVGSVEGGTSDAPYGGNLIAIAAPPLLIETLGRPWQAFGLTAIPVIYDNDSYARTRLRALDEQGEELGQVSLALFRHDVRFLGIASDTPIYAVEISGGPDLLYWDNIRFLPEPGAIEIDIKPGSPQNTVNLKSEGVIPAAILGSADLNVGDIVSDTATLAGAPVRRQGDDAEPLCHTRQVNHDAWLDLVCLFETSEMTLQAGDTNAILRAWTADGRQFEGRDAIRIVPDGTDEPPEPPGEDAPESPRIESAYVSVDTSAVAICDFTNSFLAAYSFCNDGPILLAPLIVQARYTEVRIEAEVTDPQSTPETNDIRLVAASYARNPYSEELILLRDDGSSEVSFHKQLDNELQDCGYDPARLMCTCSLAFYETTSHDVVDADDVFTAVEPMLDGRHLPAYREGLFVDCIARQNEVAGTVHSDLAGAQLDFRIEAIDQAGNLTEWPNPISVQVEPSSLACSGDPCACCLLLNVLNPADPVEFGGCRGLDGLMFDPTVRACVLGDPSLIGLPCETSRDCDGMTGNGRCVASPLGRTCPEGYCKSIRCLRPS